MMIQRVRRFCLLMVLVAVGQFLGAQTPEVTSWVLNTTGATGYKGFLTNVQSVSYTSTDAYISCTCIPGYDIGPWQSNPNIPVQENFVFKITRSPQKNSGTAVATGLGHTGVWSNGVSIFNAKDGMSYNNQGIWNRDALYWEGVSFDNCLGHPAPNGEYHHHVNPTCLYNDKDSTHHSPIIGYSFDGYPIYGAYGFSNVNGTGTIKRMRSSFVKSTATTRTNGPAVSAQYPLGCFIEDFSYVDGSGDLDNHNGRFCVTPEYPSGTYAYFVTVDETLKPVYPYTPGPTYYGVVQTGNTGPAGGHNTIPGTAQKYSPSSTAPSISIASANGASICEGTVVTCTSSITKGGTTPTFQWLKNSQPVGQNSATYVDSTLHDKDSVVCRMTSSDASATPSTVTSAALVFAVKATVVPTVSIDAPANTEFCEGTTLNIKAQSTNSGTGFTYIWKVNHVQVGTGNTLLISSLKNGDSLTVELTSTAQCARPATVTSIPMTFTVHPLPATPTVSQVDNELHSSASSGNQWYLNDQIIVGATSQVYRVSQNGSYRVRVVDEFGCSTSSKVVEIQSMDVISRDVNAEFSVRPNPFNTELILQAQQTISDAQLQLCDALGRVTLRVEHLSLAEGQSLTLRDLSIDATGVYFVHIVLDGRVTVIPLMKN